MSLADKRRTDRPNGVRFERYRAAAGKVRARIHCRLSDVFDLQGFPLKLAQALSVKRRGPGWKPSSSSVAASCEPTAESPSIRSSASLGTRPERTASARA